MSPVLATPVAALIVAVKHLGAPAVLVKVNVLKLRVPAVLIGPGQSFPEHVLGLPSRPRRSGCDESLVVMELDGIVWFGPPAQVGTVKGIDFVPLA
jgi:hypothetical protein